MSVIDEKLGELVSALGMKVDEAINPGVTDPMKRTIGFVLIVFPCDSHVNECFCVSNLERNSVVEALLKQSIMLEQQIYQESKQSDATH